MRANEIAAEAVDNRGGVDMDECFLKKLSGVRKLPTFYPTKNDHRLVTFIFAKTITDTRPQKFEAKRARAAMQS